MTDDDSALSNLIKSYFHQDAGLHGETVTDILIDYARTTSSDERSRIRAEIDQLLGSGMDPDDELTRRFPDDWDAEGLGPARAFLGQVLRALGDS